MTKGISKTSGSSVQEDSDDRFLPTSPQAGNEGDLGNIHVSPNDHSLDYQANNDVSPEVLAAPEVLADNSENDNEDRASKKPPVNDPEDKLQSSTASNSKTSMADSSGHPNDAGKKLPVQMLHHSVTSPPHQMILRMVQVQHQHKLVGKI